MYLIQEPHQRNEHGAVIPGCRDIVIKAIETCVGQGRKVADAMLHACYVCTSMHDSPEGAAVRFSQDQIGQIYGVVSIPSLSGRGGGIASRGSVLEMPQAQGSGVDGNVPATNAGYLHDKDMRWNRMEVKLEGVKELACCGSEARVRVKREDSAGVDTQLEDGASKERRRRKE